MHGGMIETARAVMGRQFNGAKQFHASSSVGENVCRRLNTPSPPAYSSFLKLFAHHHSVHIHGLAMLAQFIQGGAEPLRQGGRSAGAIVVEENDLRLVAQDMMMQRDPFQIASAQRLDNGIDLRFE